MDLNENEQYQMQMAGISTAAIGYWKPGDGIHEDYDTLALRDVARLYAKYDKLHKAIHAALNELGVPGDGYPAPVANAVEILSESVKVS